MPAKLPPRLQQLHDLLDGKGEIDCLALHAAMFPEAGEQERKHAQQSLGSYVTKLNRRLAGKRVRPGALRGHYVMTTT